MALTLFAYYALGYTLNRITLFALIFSIGILVDDAIVVVENIYRHLKMGDRTPEVAAVEAVDEVGNPTILATFTVIAAILPMAFVSGMMGPYMRPIPVGASVAMLASLAVAFIVTPYLAYRLLKGHVTGDDASARSRARRGGDVAIRAVLCAHHDAAHGPPRVCASRSTAASVALLLASVGLVFVKAVKVKMLPFDNKSEFQVVLDFPRARRSRRRTRSGRRSRSICARVPEVKSTEVYAGTAAPFNFNGLVRHYFLRSGANVADVQVNLVARANGRARVTRSRSPCARDRFDRAAIRRVGEGRGDSAGPAGALDARRRGVRRR